MALTARDACAIAVAALSRRDLSTGALVRRLQAAGADSEMAQIAVDRLISAGYVDDVRLARARALGFARKGYSDAAIDARLAHEELGREAREAALAALEPESERARRLAHEATSGGPRRIASVLVRRGFRDDSIEAALGALDARCHPELR